LVLFSNLRRWRFANGCKTFRRKENKMSENQQYPAGLLSFLYHCYYNIDDFKTKFMSGATDPATGRTLWAIAFDLTPTQEDKIIALGQNTGLSDEDLSVLVSDLLRQELVNNTDFRNRIW
jgi:hypothetical protein